MLITQNIRNQNYFLESINKEYALTYKVTLICSSIKKLNISNNNKRWLSMERGREGERERE